MKNSVSLKIQLRVHNSGVIIIIIIIIMLCNKLLNGYMYRYYSTSAPIDIHFTVLKQYFKQWMCTTYSHHTQKKHNKGQIKTLCR